MHFLAGKPCRLLGVPKSQIWQVSVVPNHLHPDMFWSKARLGLPTSEPCFQETHLPLLSFLCGAYNLNRAHDRVTESWNLRRLEQISLCRSYNQKDTALKEDPGGHLKAFGERLSDSATPTKVTKRGRGSRFLSLVYFPLCLVCF